MKKVIYLLLALAFAMPSHGQVELKKHSPDLAGHNALIREWLDTVSISYVVTEKGEKYFVRDIRGHTTAVIAPIPREMTITDMEIVTEYDIGYQPMIIPPQNIITLRTIKIIYDCIKKQ